jgi:hypothetical protein
MVDELDEADDTDQEVDHLHPLARLRPDIWAISWSKRQVLLLELTRANDWRQDWASTTDAFKVHRYARLQTRMQTLLPQGWVVDTVPLTVGIRGSLDEPAWDRTLDRFGSSIAQAARVEFFEDLALTALEELDRLYGVRSEALRSAGSDAQRN